MRTDIIGLLILFICVILFLSRRISHAVAGVFGCLLFVLLDVCSFADAFSGFSSEIVFLMAGSMIVGIAMFKTGVARILGRLVIRLSRGKEFAFLICGSVFAGLLAMFLANTAILAAFIPIVESVCRESHRMKRKNLLLPLACSVMFGGSCTLIGCTPQLTANGLLKNLAGIEMGMWSLTASGLCLFALFLLYMILFGYKHGKKVWGEQGESQIDISDEKIAAVHGETFDRKKLAVMAVISGLMIVSYVLSIVPVVVTAICAALLCILCGCCSVGDVEKELDWETIVFLASCLGIARGLTVAKTGEMIGMITFRALGDVTSPYLIFAVLVSVTLFISQFITNSTAIIITLPVALSICNHFGFNSMAFCVGITLAASLACCTPLAAAQITMTQVAGYSFMEYIRYCWPITLISLVGILIFVPLFYPLL